MGVPEIYLVRHGETVWNAEGRFQGQQDSPLTRNGIAQAQQIGKCLADVVPMRAAAALHVRPDHPRRLSRTSSGRGASATRSSSNNLASTRRTSARHRDIAASSRRLDAARAK
ncbi:MAG TPA: histidine phosphatase family protein [Stellaceae bacterium]|nr:histidine phosphatase family protein [Stellaceae bacterium]